jgi:hypothetical protein
MAQAGSKSALLEVRSPDGTSDTRPYTVDTLCEHHGAVEPTLYLTPGGKWFRRVFSHERPSLKPRPPSLHRVDPRLIERKPEAPGKGRRVVRKVVADSDD